MVGSDFITKDKERALDIYEQVTISWRRPNSTPDSDGFELIYKATKLTKGTYLTQCPQQNLTSMMEKYISYGIYLHE
jgi:hypothetical protein